MTNFLNDSALLSLLLYVAWTNVFFLAIEAMSVSGWQSCKKIIRNFLPRKIQSLNFPMNIKVYLI